MPALGRLRSPNDIVATLRAPHQRAGRFVVTHLSPDGDEGVRVAVIASRKVGSAVKRNRAKRLMRESARLVNWPDGHDVVLVARAACAEAGLGDVLAELREHAESMAPSLADVREIA